MPSVSRNLIFNNLNIPATAGYKGADKMLKAVTKPLRALPIFLIFSNCCSLPLEGGNIRKLLSKLLLKQWKLEQYELVKILFFTIFRSGSPLYV